MINQLPRLGKVASILTSRFRTSDGMYVMGQMLPPRNGSQAGLEDPRRPFRTSHNSTLTAGTLLIGGDGNKYLILNNGVSERDGVEYRTFKSLILSKNSPLQRSQKTFDPISKRTVETPTLIANIWYEIEPLRPMEDTFRVPVSQYSMITNYEVKPGDRLGEWSITQVEKRLGVYQFKAHQYGEA